MTDPISRALADLDTYITAFGSELKAALARGDDRDEIARQIEQRVQAMQDVLAGVAVQPTARDDAQTLTGNVGLPDADGVVPVPDADPVVPGPADTGQAIPPSTADLTNNQLAGHPPVATPSAATAPVTATSPLTAASNADRVDMARLAPDGSTYVADPPLADLPVSAVSTVVPPDVSVPPAADGHDTPDENAPVVPPGGGSTLG